MHTTSTKSTVGRMLWPVMACLASLAFHGAQAETSETPEIYTRFTDFSDTYTVAEDGSYVEEAEWTMTILKPQALESSKQAHVGFSTSTQEAEILAAYTVKPDGTRIDAPKSNFQLRTNKGQHDNTPVFSDRSSITVVFPEVAVGDRVHFSYRLITREPLFPGHFSVSSNFSREMAMDSARIRIDYPTSMVVRYTARDMREQVTERPEGRKRIEWVFENPTPVVSHREDFSVYDPEAEPGYAFSTFRNYGDIAKAYGDVAVAKAQVTPRISQLAHEITAGMADPRSRAEALYTWVATHITYAGNCIGIGAVVPHDLDFVLDNRMGDCKDHATLLDALLAAQGIESDQALINSGNVYTLPEIPVVSMVNHVINYLPGLDIYADATSDSTPFGMLPWGDQDKPVLLVEAGGQLRKTPAPEVGSNTQTTHAIITINADGSAHSKVNVALTGQPAVDWRAWLRDLPKKDEDTLIDNLLRGQGYQGEGIFTKADPKPLLPTFEYGFDMHFAPMLNVPGTGAFHIDPGVFSPAPISSFAGQAFTKLESRPTACRNIHSLETYEYRFPENVTILAIPKDISTTSPTIDYKASYVLDGRVLRVRREVDDRTPGNVCAPALIAAQKAEFEKLAKNVRMQVLYSAE